MKCDICHKNEATIHIQEILNGQKKNLNICPLCASEKNLTESEIEGFNLSEILYNLSSQMLNSVDSPEEEHSLPPATPSMLSQASIVCKKCGWDTVKFRETGRLGCAQCYSAFEPILSNAISSMHKGSVHIGKHPDAVEGSNAELATKVMSLQKELEQCVAKEEYEEAAKLRDKINELKSPEKTIKKRKRRKKKE